MLATQRQAVQELLSLAPPQARRFEGSEFPFPVSNALYRLSPDLATLTSVRSTGGRRRRGRGVIRDLRLTNLHVKAVDGRTVALQEGADPVHARVPFSRDRRLGGRECSFFACRQRQPGRAGIAVVGQRPTTEAPDIGVLVELGHPNADDDVCALVNVALAE